MRNQLFRRKCIKTTLEYRLKVNSVCYGVFKISVCVPEPVDAGFDSVPGGKGQSWNFGPSHERILTKVSN